MAVTAYIEKVKTLIAYFRTRLETSSHWQTVCLSAADRKNIGDVCQDTPLPFIVIWPGPSDYQNHPRHTIVIAVIVCVDAYAPDADGKLSDLSDEAVGLLDGQTVNDAEIRLAGGEPLDLDIQWRVRLLNFKVYDH